MAQGLVQEKEQEAVHHHQWVLVQERMMALSLRSDPIYHR
jgi:hypothetical protein